MKYQFLGESVSSAEAEGKKENSADASSFAGKWKVLNWAAAVKGGHRALWGGEGPPTPGTAEGGNRVRREAEEGFWASTWVVPTKPTYTSTIALLGTPFQITPTSCRMISLLLCPQEMSLGINRRPFPGLEHFITRKCIVGKHPPKHC